MYLRWNTSFENRLFARNEFERTLGTPEQGDAFAVAMRAYLPILGVTLDHGVGEQIVRLRIEVDGVAPDTVGAERVFDLLMLIAMFAVVMAFQRSVTMIQPGYSKCAMVWMMTVMVP